MAPASLTKQPLTSDVVRPATGPPVPNNASGAGTVKRAFNQGEAQPWRECAAKGVRSSMEPLHGSLHGRRGSPQSRRPRIQDPGWTCEWEEGGVGSAAFCLCSAIEGRRRMSEGVPRRAGPSANPRLRRRESAAVSRAALRPKPRLFSPIPDRGCFPPAPPSADYRTAGSVQPTETNIPCCAWIHTPRASDPSLHRPLCPLRSRPRTRMLLRHHIVL